MYVPLRALHTPQYCTLYVPLKYCTLYAPQILHIAGAAQGLTVRQLAVRVPFAARQRARVLTDAQGAPPSGAFSWFTRRMVQIAGHAYDLNLQGVSGTVQVLTQNTIMRCVCLLAVFVLQHVAATISPKLLACSSNNITQASTGSEL